MTDPPEWVPDEACGFCTSCKAPFTVIRRKHHCRSCGKVGGAPLALCIFGVVWGLSPSTASGFRSQVSVILVQVPIQVLGAVLAPCTRPFLGSIQAQSWPLRGENKEGVGMGLEKESAVVMGRGLVTFKKPDLLGQPCPEFPESSSSILCRVWVRLTPTHHGFVWFGGRAV